MKRQHEEDHFSGSIRDQAKNERLSCDQNREYPFGTRKEAQHYHIANNMGK